MLQPFSTAVARVVERRFAGDAGERSLFALASLTKPVVALAALVAVEEGVLELDAPACALLPALDDADRRSITLRHLLSHASGLPESVRGTPPLEVELKYPPGTHRAYSNEGYHLIGLLLEAATEMPFQRYITDAVIRPLGMDAFLPLPEAEQGRALEVRDPGLSSPGVPLFNAPQWRRRGNAAGGMFAALDAYARVVGAAAGEAARRCCTATRGRSWRRCSSPASRAASSRSPSCTAPTGEPA